MLETFDDNLIAEVAEKRTEAVLTYESWSGEFEASGSDKMGRFVGMTGKGVREWWIGKHCV